MDIIKLELTADLKADLKYIKDKLASIEGNFEPKKPTEFIPKQVLIKELRINPSTAWNWEKRGVLQKYQCGGKIFYKRSEVESAMIKLK